MSALLSGGVSLRSGVDLASDWLESGVKAWVCPAGLVGGVICGFVFGVPEAMVGLFVGWLWRVLKNQTVPAIRRTTAAATAQAARKSRTTGAGFFLLGSSPSSISLRIASHILLSGSSPSN